MRHYRPLKPEEEKALQAIDRNIDPLREALQREIYELEHSRLPIYRLALERMFFRQLLAACRALPYRPGPLRKVLERIPPLSARQEWDRLAREDQRDALDLLPRDPTT